MGIINRAVKRVLKNRINQAEKAYKEDITYLKVVKNQAVDAVHQEACEKLDQIDISHEADKEHTLSKHVTGIISGIV